MSTTSFEAAAAVAMAALAAVLAVQPAPAVAATPAFPSKPIRIVAVTAPSGPLDDTGRVLADHLSKVWGQPVLVDNKPGANGAIAAAIVASAPADGYTLLYSTRAISMNATLYPKLPFDTAKAFAPVAMVCKQPNVLVVSKHFAAHDVAGFMQLVKANPGKYTFGSTGSGSVPHVAGEVFKKATGTSLVHVPYKAGGTLRTDLMAGTIDMMFASIGTSMPVINDGSVIPLALASAERSPLLPQVPTFAELGIPGVNVDGWYGLFAPAGTPPEVIKRISDEANVYLRKAETAKHFAVVGVTPVVSSPADIKREFENDLVMYRKMIPELDLKVD